MFYLKKSNLKYNFLMLFIFSQGLGAGSFLAAPAPDFFPSSSGSWFFFKRLRLRLQGSKNTWLRPAPQPWRKVLRPRSVTFLQSVRSNSSSWRKQTVADLMPEQETLVLLRTSFSNFAEESVEAGVSHFTAAW